MLVLTLASLALRVGQLRFHYWIDEAISVGIASHPLSALHDLLRQDGSPPLYYLLLHGWMALWGRGEVATHALSLGFALLTVPVAYWGGAGLFGRRAGIYAAMLAAGPAVPHPVRTGDADVLAAGAALAAGRDRLRAGVRPPPRRYLPLLARVAGRGALHPQLGAVSGAGHLPRLSRGACG